MKSRALYNQKHLSIASYLDLDAKGMLVSSCMDYVKLRKSYMHTNVGSRVLDEEGFLGRFPPPVYYDEDGIANVLAMREMIAAGYRITMDTDVDNAFVVHCDGDRQMRFVNRKGVPPEELYQHNRTITNLKTDPVFAALDKIFRRYNKAGFHVKTIKCDRAFIPLTDDLLDNMGATIDPTAAGDHEPTAERNNRTLEERVRVALARLPYKVVPKVITECLGRRAAELLNVFPQKDSIVNWTR
ncbi:unnamed protein product [Cylindrotheca closterium]|uniref:Uncharacterized protein n=1 Tax=Cylindrotheca closterium TaxID=2856 RepID=A0AAD2FVJ7_9STRA|nr:unnamed protein product [Cylindrotheca closterium]